MNFKEFMSWRPNCFICGGDLLLLPIIDGLEVDCKIRNDDFEVITKQFKLSFDVNSGKITLPEKLSIDQLYFLKYGRIAFDMRCDCCVKNSFYLYTILAQPNKELTHIDFISFKEKILMDDFYALQDLEKQTCSITFFSHGQETWSNFIKLPFIDLSKFDKTAFKNKIKTYIIFS